MKSSYTFEYVGDGSEEESSLNPIPVNIKNLPDGGGGAVDSVNGQTGVVVLDAGDVGASTEQYVDNAISGISFPVNSVNGSTGAVVLTASDVGAVPASDLPTPPSTGNYTLSSVDGVIQWVEVQE